ncbi:Pumilio-like protein 2, partial [Diplonema papillatum]
AAAPPPAAVQPPLQQQQQEAQDNSQRIGVGPSLLTNPSPAHLMQHPPHPHAHIPVRPVARQVPHVQQPGMSAQAGIQQGIQPVAANKFVPQPRSVDVANPSQYQELDAAPTPPQGVLPPPTPPQQPQHRLQPAPPHHMQNPQHPFSNGQPPQQQHRFHPPPHAHQQQQQDDHHSRGHAAPSQLLEEFKRSDGSARNWDCATIRGHVPEFATDQEGSRMIQRRLEHNAATDLDIVYYELLDTALPLMTDVFGNYVIQKILEHGTELHQEGIVTAMEGHVVRLTL